LRATLAELGAVGYAALRIEDVAERAGVNKTTVYRRWPTKPDLVGAALRQCSSGPTPDTGTLRGDLISLGKHLISQARSTEGKALMRMLAVDWQHPDILDLGRQIRAEHQRARAKIIERAIARGELPAKSEPDVIIEAAIAPLHGRVKFGLGIEPRFVERLVDLVLIGARNGGARARRARSRRA